MQFRILGPVEVWRHGRRLNVGGPQQRALLALLLLHENRVTSADHLVTRLWGERPPAEVRALLRGCVARLRRVLCADAAGRGDRLATRSPGYLLRVQPGELDLDRFAALESASRHGRTEQSGPTGPSRAVLERSAGALREALALWRGAALDGVTPGACQAEAAELAERRLRAMEHRIDLDLRLGHHAWLVGELQLLVREHALRERFWAQLMLALHATDRQGDALAAARRLRDILVEQLGVEPGPTVSCLERAIRTGAEPFESYHRARAAPSRTALR
jgi:DNA-binding SARP family transcriptional activator